MKVEKEKRLKLFYRKLVFNRNISNLDFTEYMNILERLIENTGANPAEFTPYAKRQQK